jgi:hypothetical protein
MRREIRVVTVDDEDDSDLPSYSDRAVEVEAPKGMTEKPPDILDPVLPPMADSWNEKVKIASAEVASAEERR